jgi:hypothetical protein
MSSALELLEEKEQSRYQVLKQFYEYTNGRIHRQLDLSEHFREKIRSPEEAMKAHNLRDIIDYLSEEGLINDTGGGEEFKYSITRKGRIEIENSINNSEKSTENSGSQVIKIIQTPFYLDNSMNKIIQTHSGSGDNIAGDQNTQNITYNLNSDQMQTIQVLQALIDNLLEIYNPNTSTGQDLIKQGIIEHLQKDKTLLDRISKALREMGATALEEAINRPAAKIAFAGFRGFIEG